MTDQDLTNTTLPPDAFDASTPRPGSTPTPPLAGSPGTIPPPTPFGDVAVGDLDTRPRDGSRDTPFTAPDSSAPSSVIPPDRDLPSQDVVIDPPLRTDGPSMAEYLAAGYNADTYPPRGYAAKPTVPFTEVKPGDSRSGYSTPLHDDDKV